MTNIAVDLTPFANHPEQHLQLTASLKEADEVIAGALAALAQEPDPAQRQEIAVVTRQWCEYVTVLAAESSSLTGAAAAVATKAVQQRDEALTALETLTQAIKAVDTENPLVGRLYEDIEEQVHDAIFFGGGLHSECPGCDLCDHLGADHDDINIFVAALFGHIGELDDDLQAQLASFVTDFAGEIDRRMSAQSVEMER